MKRRIAVVGGGISGLTAAYALRHRARVTLFEAADRLGGHAHTHDVVAGGAHAVDSGFIVHNTRTYPLLSGLFAELGVATRETEMSMSVSCRGCGLVYAGARGLGGLFPRPGTALRGAYVRMLAEVPRFHRAARRLLAAPGGDGPTLGEFLAAGHFSGYLAGHFVVPLVSAVWSCPSARVEDYPARYLFAFLANHGMLAVRGSPRWRTVAGGSRAYVARIAGRLPDVRAATPVRSVRRVPGGVEVRDGSGAPHRFDAAVIAAHAPDALRLLADPTGAERAVLGAFGYTSSRVLLHTDGGVLPAARRARASWNHTLPSCAPDADGPRVSYDMNRLQRLGADGDVVVTLNDDGTVDPARVLARMEYAHPVYTPDAVAARRRLPDLNDGVLAFAGAYHGWGFHEDGCRAGLAAARSLGAVGDRAAGWAA